MSSFTFCMAPRMKLPHDNRSPIKPLPLCVSSLPVLLLHATSSKFCQNLNDNVGYPPRLTIQCNGVYEDITTHGGSLLPTGLRLINNLFCYVSRFAMESVSEEVHPVLKESEQPQNYTNRCSSQLKKRLPVVRSKRVVVLTACSVLRLIAIYTCINNKTKISRKILQTTNSKNKISVRQQ